METGQIRFIPSVKIPGVILRSKELSLASKRVYGVIRLAQGNDHSVSLAYSEIAYRACMSRQAVSRAVQQLVKNKLLKTHQQPRRSTRFSIRAESPKKFFLFLHNDDSGQSLSRLFILNYLKFRQGEGDHRKDNAFPHIKTIADDLGLSKSTVIGALAELEKDLLIQVKHAHGGLKQGNKYALTQKGRAAFGVSFMNPRTESGVQKCNTNNNTSLEFKENNPEISSERILSGSERSEKRLLLTHEGIAWPVADALASQHSRESIENAVLNAYGQQKLKWENSKSVKIPAYIVGTLNRARREGHAVTMNRYMQQRKADHEAQKQPRPLKEQLNAAQITAKKRAALNPAVLKALGLSPEKITETQKRLENVA